MTEVSALACVEDGRPQLRLPGQRTGKGSVDTGINRLPPGRRYLRLHCAPGQTRLQRLRSGYDAYLVSDEDAQLGRELASHVPIIWLETDNSATRRPGPS